MLEFGLGFVAGAVVTGIGAMFDCHRHRVKRTIEQEKEYVKLQQHVDQCVDIIERIVHGSKP